jgi:hypothetical protein
MNLPRGKIDRLELITHMTARRLEFHGALVVITRLSSLMTVATLGRPAPPEPQLVTVMIASTASTAVAGNDQQFPTTCALRRILPLTLGSGCG